MRKTLRLVSFLLVLIISFTASATRYVFTGNGSFDDPSKWEGGSVPPGYYNGSTDTIYIRGHVQSVRTCIYFNSVCVGQDDFFQQLNGTLIIEVGGTVNFNNVTQFSNLGDIVVNGTLINNTTFNMYPFRTYNDTLKATVTVRGTLINNKFLHNQGRITVSSGGNVENKSNAKIDNNNIRPGIFTVENGGSLINSGSFVFSSIASTISSFINETTLSGSPVISGSLTNRGVLAPGNSPGKVTVTEDYMATATSVHNFEVGGTAANAYDQLQVTGTAFLNGTLNVSLINGFVPSAADPGLPIITGTINGTFATVNKPADYQVIYTANSVTLHHIATLPVRFGKVDVQKDGAATYVTWQVFAEKDIQYYEIEKSRDGKTFFKAGNQKAAAQTAYSFRDLPFENKTWYRIKSVANDGQYSYSVVLLYNGGKSAVPFSVFPSPTQADIQIQHASAYTNSKILLSAVDGRIVQTIWPGTGSQLTVISLSGLPSGTYFVRFINGTDAVQLSKFIKQ